MKYGRLNNYWQNYSHYDFASNCLNVHISNNNMLNNIKACVVVGDIGVQGTMPKKLVSGLSFDFMSKNGQIFYSVF